MTAFQLNKSVIKAAMQCLRRGHLLAVETEPKPTPTASEILLLEQGIEVGVRARRMFPDGALIEAGFNEAKRQTALALNGDTRVLFEAAFEFAPVGIRTDILVVGTDGKFDLYEVKSGSDPDNSEYIHDLAIQIFVLCNLGYQVRAWLVLPDNEATIRSPSLFKTSDRTDQARHAVAMVQDIIGRLSAALAVGNIPPAQLGRVCKGCRFLPSCFPDLPEHSPLTLYRVTDAKIQALEQAGIRSLIEIEDADKFKLTEFQQRQVACVRSKRPWLGRTELALRWPLTFIDFETYSGLPEFDNQRIFEPLPFQFSAHVLRSQSHAPEHYEFLADAPGDPRSAFARALLSLLGTTKSSLVSYSGYEVRIIKRLAEVIPEHQRALMDLTTRFVDLLPVCRAHVYFPEQKGSYSIKALLPQVSELSYRGLEIKDGLSAGLAYQKLLRSQSEEERGRISAALREYCKMDTLAMVELFKRLVELNVIVASQE